MHVTSGPSSNETGFLSEGPASYRSALISRDRVAVWWMSPEDLRAGELEIVEGLLVDEERERAGRFHFDRDRQIYIAAHGICRGLLTYCFGKAPESWRFMVADHGKPELVWQPGDPRIRVNISHTRGMAAVALTVESDIGVDVEWRQRDPEVEQLAKRMFAASECQLVLSAPENEKRDRFLAFWTLKEAYVKAIGKGLSQPLDAFSFSLDTLEISFQDTSADDPEKWHFERYQPGLQHMLALAVNHPNKERLSVDARPAPLDFLLALTAA